MRKLVDNIFLESGSVVLELFDSRIQELVQEKMDQLKMMLTAEMYEEIGFDLELSEGNIQKMGRTKIIRVRVRNGKIQRRVKKSTVKGYEMKGGRLQRMSSAERLHRKMGARRGRFKRKAKMQQIIRKRQRSLRKRGTMGITR